MRTIALGFSLLLLLAGSPVHAQKVVLGMSGWTGFSPLSLAERAGIFKKNGVEVELRMIPPVPRSTALASGALNAAATTVDQHIVWMAAGIASVQVALIDKSNGGDGVAVRHGINSIKELKGKTVNVDGPGTVQHFMLSYILEKNGLTIQDVIRSQMAAQPAAQAFVSGQGDAAVTYEPYLSTVRAKPDAGRILVTSKDYPVVVDTLVFRTDFIKQNRAVVKKVVDSFFEAQEMIRREPAKSFELMGAVVKQSGEQFAKSAQFISWTTRQSSQEYYAKEHAQFVDFAVRVLKFNRVINKDVKPKDMIDTSFH
jgi:NitT/TauT family transport system substrate-binding protein